MNDSLLSDVYQRMLELVPVTRDGRRCWSEAPPYLLRHAMQHAADADRVDELVLDSEFLVNGDPAAVTLQLRDVRSDQAKNAAMVYLHSLGRHFDLDSAARRQILTIDAVRHHAHQLADVIFRPPQQDLGRIRPYLTTAVAGRRAQRFVVNVSGEVTAICFGTLGGRPVSVSASWDVVQVCDVSTGKALGQVFLVPTDESIYITTISCIEVDGHPIVAAGSTRGLLRIWDMRSGRVLRDIRLAADPEPWSPTRTIECVEIDGRAVIVVSDPGGWFRLFDPLTGELISEFGNGTGTAAHPAVCTSLRGRNLLIACGSSEITIWDIQSGRRSGHPLINPVGERLIGVATAEFRGRPAVIAIDETGFMCLWDLAAKQLLQQHDTFSLDDVMVEHFAAPFHVTGIASVIHDGRTTAVVLVGVEGLMSDHREVHIWEFWNRKPRRRLFGHVSSITKVACGRLAGKPVAVTGGADRTVRAWNLDTSRAYDAPSSIGHSGAVFAVQSTLVDGRPVAVTGGDLGEIWCWRSDVGNNATGTEIATDGSPIYALRRALINGRSTIVSGHADGGVRLWDLSTEECVGELLLHEGQAIWGLDITWLHERQFVVAGSHGTAWVWDLRTRQVGGQSLSRVHRSWVRAVRCVRAGNTPAVLTGGDDGNLVLWDFTTRRPVERFGLRENGRIRSISSCDLNDSLLVLTGHQDGTIRTWRLTDSLQSGPSLLGHTGSVQGIDCVELAGGRTVAVSCAQDGTVRVWDISSESEICSINLPAAPTALSLNAEGILIVAFSWQAVAFKLDV